MTVVANNGSLGSSVISRGDGSESFLACRVPNLQFDDFVRKLNKFSEKVNADGSLMAQIGVDLVIGSNELAQETRLADRTVANDDYHELYVEVCIVFHCLLLCEFKSHLVRLRPTHNLLAFLQLNFGQKTRF